MTKLSPIVSEFETEEEAAAYDIWFGAKVEIALSDPRPKVAHAQAKARMQRILDDKRLKC